MKEIKFITFLAYTQLVCYKALYQTFSSFQNRAVRYIDLEKQGELTNVALIPLPKMICLHFFAQNLQETSFVYDKVKSFPHRNSTMVSILLKGNKTLITGPTPDNSDPAFVCTNGCSLLRDHLNSRIGVKFGKTRLNCFRAK